MPWLSEGKFRARQSPLGHTLLSYRTLAFVLMSLIDWHVLKDILTLFRWNIVQTVLLQQAKAAQ